MTTRFNVVDYGGVLNDSSVVNMTANYNAIQTIFSLITGGGSGGYITWNENLYLDRPIQYPLSGGTGISPFTNPISYGIIGNGINTVLRVTHSGVGISISGIYQYNTSEPAFKQILKKVHFVGHNYNPHKGLYITGIGDNIDIQDVYTSWFGTGIHIQNCDGLVIHNTLNDSNSTLSAFIESSNNIEIIRGEFRSTKNIEGGDGIHIKSCDNIYGWADLENNGYWGGVASGLRYSDMQCWFENNRSYSNTNRGGSPYNFNDGGAQLPHIRLRDSYNNNWRGQIHHERGLSFDGDTISHLGNHIQSVVSGYYSLGEPIGGIGKNLLQCPSLVGILGNVQSTRIDPQLQTQVILPTGYYINHNNSDANRYFNFDNWNAGTSFKTTPRYSGDYCTYHVGVSGTEETMNFLRNVLSSGNPATAGSLFKFTGYAGVTPFSNVTWMNTNSVEFFGIEPFPNTTSAFSMGGLSGVGLNNMFMNTFGYGTMPNNTIPLEFYFYNAEKRIIRNGRPTETASLGGMTLNYVVSDNGYVSDNGGDFVFTKYNSNGESVTITASVMGLFQTIMRGLAPVIDNAAISSVYEFNFKKTVIHSPHIYASGTLAKSVITGRPPNTITNIF